MDSVKGGDMKSYMEKIMDLASATAVCRENRAAGRKTVFTNGCFDILHPGHIRYLFASRQLGDFLLVAVNSDQSVKSIKDPGRPIFSDQVRSEMVASLGFVDAVLVFEEDNPLSVIQSVLPDILVKGGDWQEKDIIGADIVKAAGGEVIRIPFVTGFSTTGLIKEILARYA